MLFDAILEEIPAPGYHLDEPFQMLVSDLGYSDYLGRLAVGKVFNGRAFPNEAMVCINEKNEAVLLKISKLQAYEGMKLKVVEVAEPGDIIVLSGIENVKIGDTICSKASPKQLKRVAVDEPTISMEFTINRSPLVGREGNIVQSASICKRLLKETLQNVAVTFEYTQDRESFILKGRGEFQMAILVETMRREGFELSIGRPKVIYKKENGKLLEPVEKLFVDCNENFLGIVTEKLSLRKGRMTNLINNSRGRVMVEFSVPSRSLIGYRDEFLTDTKGTGIMNTLYSGYEEFRGEFPTRFSGSIVSDRNGLAVAYALFHLEPRGSLFIKPGEPVYEGMVIGEHNKDNDINVNPCKEKKLTNIRAAGKDESAICTPVKPMTLERAINFIKDDEMVEVTPVSIRIHKRTLSLKKRHSDRSAKYKVN